MNPRLPTLLSLAILLLALSMTASTPITTPVVKADWNLIDSGTFEDDLNAFTCIAYQWHGFDANQLLHFHWSTGVVGVDFMILDEVNYNLYIHGQLAYLEFSVDGTSNSLCEWYVPRDNEVWYTLWCNRGPLATHLTCSWYQYEWTGPIPPWGLSPWPILIASIALITFIVIIVVVLRRRRKAKLQL
ncbi:MAG: hypothetical protein ACFFCO_08620 [Promethearchaeota archaeon]